MASSLLERLAGWSQRRHWMALVLWVAVLVGITAGSQLVGTDYHDDFSLPGTESQEAGDVLEKHAPEQAGDTIQIVVHQDDGLQEQSTRQRVEAMLHDVAELPHVATVNSPYGDPAAISQDGTIAYATVVLDGKFTEVPIADVETIIDTAHEAGGDGPQVELGGDAIRNAEEGEGGAAEGAGMLAALVILVLMFGSFLAASLPLITAAFAVGSTVGAIALLSNTVTVASYTPPLMMLVGIGVGIDYALLVYSRYRSEILQGAEREEAARTALDTAGRSVLFAGATVIVALLGLYVLGLGSLQGVALAVALTVLVTVIAAISLLPALLTLFGGRIERRIKKHAQKARRLHGDRWRSWGGVVQRNPWPPLVLAVIVLATLAAPAFSMRLGFADAGTEEPGLTSRQAYDLLAEGFGPGFNGPLILVSEGGQQAADAVHQELAETAGVAAVSPPQMLPDGKAAMMFVIPDSSPQDEETSDLVAKLREDVLPPLENETGATYLVGGSTAAADDFSTSVTERMPLFLLVVVGLSALLLMAVFRSVLVPLKAAVLNILSIGASLGVITVVFQEGLFGVQPGPIEAFVPVMIFAIVFGLSMDYEVFLVSRMHEEWRRTKDSALAVREGLAMTGGVITAAAAIMIVVFGAFVLSPTRMLQQFGLGLAVAVLLDALVIRCLIVPAVMRLFGVGAWWLPGWLDRLLPKVALERDADVAPVSPDEVPAGRS
jgi:RND superfamily putative drug exporter